MSLSEKLENSARNFASISEYKQPRKRKEMFSFHVVYFPCGPRSSFTTRTIFVQ